MPQGDAQLQLGTQHGEMEAAMDVFAPCRVTAFTTPEVEIALLVAGPPLVRRQLSRQKGVEVVLEAWERA